MLFNILRYKKKPTVVHKLEAVIVNTIKQELPVMLLCVMHVYMHVCPDSCSYTSMDESDWYLWRMK